MRFLSACATAGCALLAVAWTGSAAAQRLSSADISRWPATPATARIAYGDDPLQFGELRLPPGPGPFPVAVVVHGGCWLSRFDIVHIGRLAEALTREGIATWAIEYRRIGDPGGGWPTTFHDVALGTDHLRSLAGTYPLDLSRVLAVGHSAGGQFALWLAGRRSIPPGDTLSVGVPLGITAVLALSPATDVAEVQRINMCGGAMGRVMGGSPEESPDRYRHGSPIEMPALGVPQILIYGTDDMPPIPPMVKAYADRNRALGDPIEVMEATESGHFEVIDPASTTWPTVRAAARRLLALP